MNKNIISAAFAVALLTSIPALALSQTEMAQNAALFDQVFRKGFTAETFAIRLGRCGIIPSIQAESVVLHITAALQDVQTQLGVPLSAIPFAGERERAARAEGAATTPEACERLQSLPPADLARIRQWASAFDTPYPGVEPPTSSILRLFYP
jgi:hypothetical protein